MIAVIILAAGQGSRFGGDKLMAKMPDGRSLIEHSLSSYLALGLPITCVVRSQDHALRRHLQNYPIFVLPITNANQGLSTTLIAGLEHCADFSGWIIGLGDMPMIKTDTLINLADTLDNGSEKTIVVLKNAQGKQGNPVGFSHHFYQHLVNLKGDRGARQLIRNQVDSVSVITTSDLGIFVDVDTKEQLKNL